MTDLPPHPDRRAVLAGAGALLMARPVQARSLSLREIAARHGRLYGAAIEPLTVDGDPAFHALVQTQCGLVTPENAMKWNAIAPAAGVFDFAQADRVMTIAKAQGAAVHGHCLVWHEAMPPWLAAALRSKPSPDAARSLMVDHIRRVAGRYRGRIRSWDVVNEAVERNDLRPDGLRRSPWLQALGPEYLALAFRTARAADPHARLALADYGLEYDDEPWMQQKRGTMLQLLRGLKADGVPIDALSIQGHLLGDRPPAFGPGLRDFLRQVAALGLQIYVSELDVNDQKMAGSVAERDRASALIYRRFLDVALAEPAVRSVATWGLSDRYTSKTTMFARGDHAPVRPLPFDQNLAAKPSAYAIAEAFGRD
ncbi:MAG: endo-1,4-beta-xylanase [Caulobacteraceae bacterium]